MSNSFSLIDKLESANIEFLKALYGCKSVRLNGGWLLWSDILPERFCNLAVAIRSSQRDALRLISQTTGEFRERGIKPGFQITPATRPKNFVDLLVLNGFVRAYFESWMIHKKQVKIRKLKEIEIIRVQTTKGMQRFVELFNSFGSKSDEPKSIEEAYEKVLWRSFEKRKEKIRIEHYLAILNQKEVAFGTLAVTKNYVSIYNIGVLEPFRCRGVGSTLVNRLISEAMKLKIKKIFLQTSQGSLAQKFFCKLGFRTLFLAEIFEKNKIE